ncbi:hypothetical protein BDQ17DRAFT_1244254 [Cyathus striatus]|nr:hypothetical protein BDQ17DRAFT_1244254 [Cyathus striatus]
MATHPSSTHTFSNAHNVNIQNRTLNNVTRNQIINQGGTNDMKEKLSQLKPLSHNKFNTPGCMEGTRKGLLNNIDNWLNDFNASSNILWITEYPGAGKSAIASTLVSKLSKTKRLCGFHFFRRDDNELNDP